MSLAGSRPQKFPPPRHCHPPEPGGGDQNLPAQIQEPVRRQHDPSVRVTDAALRDILYTTLALPPVD